MCGIAGIASLNGRPVGLDELRWMCAAMVHRGPDDDGFHLADGIGLGMRRLSIIDLHTGRQPIHNEDGSVWVVFNGELYNCAQQRRELERLGHSFYTSTDTEIIVHLYEEYGMRCMEKMRGMFCFALWDERRKKLLIARDRLGIKPLYYAEVGGRLIFASELKAVLQVPEIERTLNFGSVNHLFSFLSTPHTESIIEGVHKLEPGHFLTASAEEGVSVEPYWNVKFEPDYSRNEEYFVERLRELLQESVRLRMIADVPLGAFLSGGIDSSAVVATMAGISSTPVKTFSIGFPEGDFNELNHARRVAEKFGTEHHELMLEPDVLDIVEDLAWHLDEPFGDSSAIPTYMVSKLASQHVTVVLSGDGGDELFAGYDRYLVEERERKYRFLPAFVRQGLASVASRMPQGMKGKNFLRHMALSGPDRYLDAGTLFRRDEKQQLFQNEAFELMGADPAKAQAKFLAEANGNWLSALQQFDLKNYLPLDILTKVDRMSMAHSIEARVPLVDHKLVEFAATIPPELKLKNGVTKYIFKQAMRGILPDEIIDRRKQGFAVPLGRWFRGKLGSFVRDLVLSDTSKRRGIVNPAYVENLLHLHERGRNLDLQLWTLISFELWCRTFLDSSSRRIVNGRQNGLSLVV